MKYNDLKAIFGTDAIWDFYLNNIKIESLRYDSLNNFITCSGKTVNIFSIKVYLDSGIIRFKKHCSSDKVIQSTLVFIRDKSVLIGHEGTNHVKYIKTEKESFS